jgi:5-formyltetrahydrofolate cyclo-ligase
VPDFPSEAEKSRATKFTLRNRMITLRRTMPESVRRAAATSIQTHLRSLLPPATIAAYVPVGWEPGGSDLAEFIAAAMPAGGRLLLPVLLVDGDLDWALYDGPHSLQAGPRGLREPAGRRLGTDAIREAELVIVPALAVDQTGMRLGRGGGSYDRALTRAGSAITVALLHDGEIIDSVPAEKHDKPVNAAITPRGGVALSADPEWTK